MFAEDVAVTALTLQPLEVAVEDLAREVAGNKTELRKVGGCQRWQATRLSCGRWDTVKREMAGFINTELGEVGSSQGGRLHQY